MTFATLIRRSLRFHARTHLGVVIGAAIASAALIGALVIGDSVKESLKESALRRLGNVEYALFTKDRLFQANLGDRIHNNRSVYRTNLFSWSTRSATSSALWLEGMATKQDGTARANRINVIGVDVERWKELAAWSEDYFADSTSGVDVLINQALARQLSVTSGDEIVARIRKPSALALDAVVSPRDENSVALRLRVARILPPEKLGDFSLVAGQVSSPNLFLPLSALSNKLGLTNAANLILIGSQWRNRTLNDHDRFQHHLASWLWQRSSSKNPDNFWWRMARSIEPKTAELISAEDALRGLNDCLAAHWKPEDGQLSVRATELPQHLTGGEFIPPSIEISSPRIFLESFVENAALHPVPPRLSGRAGLNFDTNYLADISYVTNGAVILTYLANLIQSDGHSTPYSMVTAAEAGSLILSDMKDDEIRVSEWLAQELNLKPGSSVQVSYYVVDSGSSLVQRTNIFRVRDIVPLKGIFADRSLMPEFPGIAKAESTHDWDAGFPLTYPIRPKDEDYWKQYRGTPKAFITLAAGQSMWSNRFGSFTAIRYPTPTNSFPSSYLDTVYKNLRANLRPEQFGMQFTAVREQALKAAESTQDFGGLFLGFSIFLVVAALLLMALLFQFGLEQRAAEVGIYLALGFSPRKVKRMFLWEGTVLATVGAIIGAAGGTGYAKALLWALTTVWRDAVGATSLKYHALPATISMGIAASVLVAVLTLWLTLRKLGKQPARVLLAGAGSEENLEAVTAKQNSATGRWPIWAAAISGVIAIGIVAWALIAGETSDAETFFSAGSLLLMAGLFAATGWLRAVARQTDAAELTLARLGVRASARRRKRSVATIALLASGCFLIVAVGVFRLDAKLDGHRRSSGTGGFTLLGQTTLPVIQDLNTQAGQEAFGLGDADSKGVQVVSIRVHDGDEASCVNLNKPLTPRLLGVNPDALTNRFSFTKLIGDFKQANGWEALRHTQLSGTNAHEIPAIADANSIEWSLHKKLGETIDYTDAYGRVFKLRLVGAVANSILQGSILIDEAEFVKRFPGESGYRMFLFDTPSNSVTEVSEKYSRALQDRGLELTPTVQRLNEFNAVQNTYLGTFQWLGGLGLLLGSAGLGIVVLRNVLERRGEFALLTAVGFPRRQLRNMTLAEHGALLIVGLGLGILAALLAVLPNLFIPGKTLPYLSLGITLLAIILNGLLWTWIATRLALRGNLLNVLRNE